MRTGKTLLRLAATFVAIAFAVPAFAQNSLSELLSGVSSAAGAMSAYGIEDETAYQMSSMGAFNSLQGTSASGLIIGYNFANGSVGEDNGGSALDKFNIGYAFKMGLPLGFSIQPALMYNTKKINLNSVLGNDMLSSSVKFIEVPIQIQWGPKIRNFRPFIFGEPFVGYGFAESTNLKQYVQDTAMDILTEEANVTELKEDVINKLEYGIGAGFGISYGAFQISAKYYRNLGNLYIDNTNISEIGNIFSSAMKENYIDGFTFSIGIIF